MNYENATTSTARVPAEPRKQAPWGPLLLMAASCAVATLGSLLLPAGRERS
jgi:hypothetical protein